MSEIYDMPGHLIRRLHQISTSVFADLMKELALDLTAPQFAALSVISANPGLDQASLAGLIAHDRPTIGGIVERLEGKGLVRREQSDVDRRAKILSLTAEGAALLERITPRIRSAQSLILTGLSEAEQAQFVALAARIARDGNALSRAPLVTPQKG